MGVLTAQALTRGMTVETTQSNAESNPKARTDLSISAPSPREAIAIAPKPPRGELIEKSLVERQAAFIFISLRQAILTFPTKYARRIVGLRMLTEAKQILRRTAHEFLTELAGFPEKAIDPNWLQSIELRYGKSEDPSSIKRPRDQGRAGEG